FISVACALPVNREPGMPLPVMPFAWGSDERARQMAEGSTRVYDWLMAPHRSVIERRARAFGIPARGMLHECLSPLAQISQTVAAFDFPRLALPAHFHHVGPLRHPARHGSDHREPKSMPTTVPVPDLDPGRPFIFASLGTLQGQRFDLFRRIARACRQLDAQLLLAHCGGLSARQEVALQAAGATWVCAFADQQQVLARADAVVTHAGLNTVMDAIAARTPMLALPIAFDQPGAAARICHAGIGLRASPRFASPRHLAAQLRRLLQEPRFSRRLEPMADAVASAGGAARAADIVEQSLRLRTASPAGMTA
ncbi:MAG TPA: glycosyltransferase, partial [Pseudoduganella sp.]